MEHWRSYFRKARVDIWSVIHHAIHVAAMDHPKDFRRMQGEIAKTLFARELVRSHSMLVEAETVCTFEEGKVEQGVRKMVEMQADPDGVADQVNDDLGRHCFMCHDEVEALTDEVLEEINIIKESCIDADQPETVVFEGLRRLKYMKITVQMLEVTELGKKVKGLQKHPSIRVSALAKELVSHWRRMAREWIDVAEETAAVTITTTAGTECGEFSKQDGLLLPRLDEDAVLEARASSVELSQLFSFIDEDKCGERFNEGGTVEPFIKNNLGSMLTESSDFDDNAQKRGLEMAEGRGSATRDRIGLHKRETDVRGQKEANGRVSQDDDNGLMVLNNAPKCSGPGRPESDMPRTEFTSSTGKSPSNLTSISRSSLLPKNVAAHTSLATMNSDKNLADQKLEIAKRKLHKGYAEAENAKKQHTVQVLDVSDLPKSGHAGRTRAVQTKSGTQRGFLSQNGRYS